MGSQFSVGPFPRSVQDFVNMDLVQVQAKIYRFERTLDRYHVDNVFMTRKQFQWTFQLSDVSTYKLFQKFDPELKGYAAALDIWCALALAASSTTGEKINFIGRLIDLNRDNYISQLDFTVLLRCSTRGFANLKGVVHVPLKTIHILAHEAFHRVGLILNESGEINIRDLHPYLLVDDKPRTYLSNLGTLIVVEDSSKLIEHRAELLKELAEIESELQEVQSRYNSKQADELAYQSERGGDSHLVRLTEKLLVQTSKRDIADEKPKDVLNLTSAEKQRMRRDQRLLEAVGEVDNEGPADRVTSRDGGAFSRGCKPIAMTGTGGAESAILDAILYKWTTLKPQSADKLFKLDLDTLLDLFEAAGVVVSDEQAMDCLQSLPTNVLGRHSVHDVLLWLRRFSVNPSPHHIPSWRRELFQYREQFLGWLDWVQGCLNRINYQDLALKEIVRYNNKLEEQASALIGEVEEAEGPGAGNKTVQRAQSKQISTGKQSGGNTSVGQKKSQKSNNTFENVIKGSIRLSAWQRHRQMSKPSKCGLLATFGPPLQANNQVKSTTTTGKPKGDPKPTYHGKIRVELFTKPEGKKRETLVSGDGIVREFELLTPSDLLNHFDQIGYVVELSEAEKASEAAYAAARAAGLTMSGASGPSSGSKTSHFIAWFIFRVAEKATAQEAFCLLKTATNFFESIPLDYRHEIYTSTKGQMFYLEPNNTVTAVQPTDGTKKQNPRIICVALLHERDPYKHIEDQIKALNLLFTRALRSLKIELQFMKSLNEMYDESTEFDNYHEKLFGPQEDELGEEGMNPLRFAKMCRKRQQAAQEAIEKAAKMPLDELKLHLSTRGLNIRGTKEELVSRVQEAFKRQADLIGYGEMSGYGASMVKKIFDLFDEDKDGALSLMEINKYLLATGSEAFYDSKAYKSLMMAENFLLDSHYRLTLEGLTAYYEKYGRLARDIQRLGLGSFNQTGQGEIEVRLDYESDAIQSLYNIFEPNTLAQPLLKHIFGVISSTSDVLLTGNFQKLSDLFHLLRFDQLPYVKIIADGIKQPGWVSHLIHSLSEWLADEDQGIVPLLRANSKSRLNNYSNFIKVFQKLNAPPEIKKISSDDEDDQTAGSTDKSTLQSNSIPPLSSPEEIEMYLNDSSNRKHYVEMFQIFYKNCVVKPIDSSTEVEDEDESEKCRPLEPKHPEIERWIQQLDEVLPRIIAYSSKKTLMSEELNQRLAGAATLYDRLSGNERLTRTERDRLQFLKLKCERRAAKLATQLEDSVHLCGAHFLSFYDAFRLYGDGIAQFGCGTNEMGFKVNLEGFDWMKYLPEGLGEPSILKQKEKEKYERAMLRKNAALNAIERERLRRDLDEEEREKRRLWEIANAQLARDEEEKNLFSDAYSALIGAREEKISTKEIDEIIDAWKNLLDIRESRYPLTLKHAVCLNDVACVIFEICSDRPILIAQAVEYLRTAAQITITSLQTIFKREILITEGLADAKSRQLQLLNDFNPQSQQPQPQSEQVNLKKKEALASTDGVRTALSPNSPAAFLLLLINFLISLRITKNIEELNDSFCQIVKEGVYMMNELLSDKEKTTIHVERSMELFTIFPLGDIKSHLSQSLEELEEHRKQYHILIEKEKLKRRLEEFKGVGGNNHRKEGLIMTKNDQQIGMEMLALVDPKKAARIKFRRQQREARKKRTQSIKERNKMYRMIASDEISTVFYKHSKRTDQETELEWGDDKLQTVDDPFEISSDSESSEDSFATKQKKIHRKVDTSLAEVTFQPALPIFVTSPREKDQIQQLKEDDEEDHPDGKSDVSSLSEVTPIPTIPRGGGLRGRLGFGGGGDAKTGIRRESRIMAWLMRNRGGGGGGGEEAEGGK